MPNLINDFKVRNRIHGEKGILLGKSTFGAETDVSLDTTGRILSAGVDLLTVFYNGLTPDATLTFGNQLVGFVTATPGTPATSYNTNTAITFGITSTPAFATVSATGLGTFGSALINGIPISRGAAGITSESLAIGTDTLAGATGVRNLAIGDVALGGIDSTSDSIGIGVRAGYQTLAGATLNYASNSLFFGNYTKALADGGTNQIVIGHGAVGAGSNSTVLGNSSTVKTIIKGNLGLGTDTPNHKVSVVGSVSATDFIYTSSHGNSQQWNDATSVFNTVSGALVNDVIGNGQGILNFTRVDGTTFGASFGLEAEADVVFASLTTTGNLTVQGNLVVEGTTTTINTTVAFTSAISVINDGTGPALRVEQTGLNPIAHFIDSNGDDIIFDNDGRIGVGVASPTEKIDVLGNIKASGTVTSAGVTVTTLGTGTGNSVVTEESGVLKKRTIDDRVWGTTLVDGGNNLDSGKIPVATGGSNLDNSALIYSATGSGRLTVGGEITQVAAYTDIDDVTASNSTKKFITGSVGNYVTNFTTFPKVQSQSGGYSRQLVSVKYTVTIIGGSDVTAFEIMATRISSTDVMNGTIYAVVDSTSTQLSAADVAVSSGNVVLSITAVSEADIIIDGTAYYRELPD